MFYFFFVLEIIDLNYYYYLKLKEKEKAEGYLAELKGLERLFCTRFSTKLTYVHI